MNPREISLEVLQTPPFDHSGIRPMNNIYDISKVLLAFQQNNLPQHNNHQNDAHARPSQRIGYTDQSLYDLQSSNVKESGLIKTPTPTHTGHISYFALNSLAAFANPSRASSKVRYKELIKPPELEWYSNLHRLGVHRS